MNKYIYFAGAFIVVIFILFFVLKKYNSKTEIDTFDNVKHQFVLHYLPTCGHCHALMPTWNKLEDAYKGNKYIDVIKIDNAANPQDGISRFPTMIFKKKNGEQVMYNGDRTYADLVNFINRTSA